MEGDLQMWRLVLGYGVMGALIVGLFVWHLFFESTRHDD